MTESEVKAACVVLLEVSGWEITHFSINRPTHSQLAGVPDIYCTHAGHKAQMWLELKGSGKPTRPSQERWMTRTQASGALCLVIDSVDRLEDHLRKRGFIT